MNTKYGDLIMYKVYFDFKSSDLLTERTFETYDEAEVYRNEHHSMFDAWESWVTDEEGNIVDA